MLVCSQGAPFLCTLVVPPFAVLLHGCSAVSAYTEHPIALTRLERLLLGYAKLAGLTPLVDAGTDCKLEMSA